MKMIVDIPEDAYDYLINTSFVENPKIMFNQSVEDRKHTMQLFEVIDAVKNGTPLPKGHGRLIDADALEKKMTEYINTLPLAYDEAERIVLLMNHFDDAPTIIEADKGE